MAPRSNRRKKEKNEGPVRWKRPALACLALLLAGATVFGALLLYKRFSEPAYAFFNRLVPVRRIVIEGNHRVSADEIAGLVDTRENNMFTLNSRDARQELLASPWISEVRIRKEFPATLRVIVGEREPVALLLKGNDFHYLDSDGKRIEKVAGNDIPFLPVITGGRDMSASFPAMELVRALREKEVLKRVESVELSLKDPDCIVMQLDGIVMKMGTEGFSEKLERWLDIESEVYRRRISVDHVDLRFEDKVILTPLKAAGGKG